MPLSSLCCLHNFSDTHPPPILHPSSTHIIWYIALLTVFLSKLGALLKIYVNNAVILKI